MKIAEYKVIGTVHRNELNEQVNLMIDEGWQPFGPAAFQTDQDGSWYVQTMVKYA